jgi:glycine dehydrogenase subunit 2
VSPIDENHLHADPGIDAVHPHPSAAGSAAPPLQREIARTIFQKGAPGRRAFVCPDLDVPAVDISELLPERFRRTAAPRLPEVSEPEIVRHYVGIRSARAR